MSRLPIRSFLSQAKQSLSQSLRNQGKNRISFVIGNQSADLDSIVCALFYGYIQSDTKQHEAKSLVIPITNIPRSGLRLRPELTALLRHADIEPSELITLDDVAGLHKSVLPESTEWTVVDHNVLLGDLGKHFSKQVNGVIDHHEDEKQVPETAKPRIIEKTGSCTSLVVDYCRGAWDGLPASDPSARDVDGVAFDAQVALLALGPILIDTVNLKAEDKVTEHDLTAIEYLEQKIRAADDLGNKYDRDTFFKEINDAKSNLDHLSVEEIFEKDYKEWTEGDLTLGISSVVRSINYLTSKAPNLHLEMAMSDFAKSRNLDLHVIMTAHNEEGIFERQIIVMAITEGKAVDAAKKFIRAYGDELRIAGNEHTQAERNLPDGVQWMKIGQQKNLEASRKKVAPMLREAMR